MRRNFCSTANWTEERVYTRTPPSNVVQNMRMLCVALLFCACVPGLQAQQGLWQHLYGGSAYDELAAPLVLGNGTLLAVGSTRSTDGDLAGRTALDFDGWLIKTDPLGNMLWQQRYGGTGHDRLVAIAALPTGGFVLVGTTESLEFTHGEKDIYVVRTDALGRVLWERAYGGSGNDAAYDVIVLRDGHLLIAGETGSRDGDVLLSRGGIDLWLLKLDLSGGVVWQRTFGGAGTDRCVAARETLEGDIIALGSSDSPQSDLGPPKGGTDWVFIRLDAYGNLRWSKRYGGSSEDEPHALTLSPFREILATGTTFSRNFDVERSHGEGDVWLVSLREDDGTLKWEETYGGESHDGANALAYSPDASIYIAGTSRSMKGQRTEWKGLFDGWLLKVNARGGLIWQHTLGGFQQDYYLGMALNQDSDILLTGSTRSDDKDLYMKRAHGGFDAWLLAIRPPENKGKVPPKLPTLVSGYVTDAATGKPLEALVRLTGRANAIVGQVTTQASDGLFQFSVEDVTGLSLGAAAPGHMLYSEAMRLIPEEVGTEIRVDIALDSIRPGDRYILNNLRFEPGQSNIPQEAYPELDRLALFMQLNPAVVVYLDGHADSSATELVMKQLSFERAHTVRTYLRNKGVGISRMEIRPFESSRPLFPGNEPEALQLNRRVEVVIRSS